MWLQKAAVWLLDSAVRLLENESIWIEIFPHGKCIVGVVFVQPLSQSSKMFLQHFAIRYDSENVSLHDES